ncbi:methionine--tRNA ligase [Candidatus Pacearchaeota archaeon]|nr:methionine--tRNA ligase [Candidatus Pacearchaeota archaeon]
MTQKFYITTAIDYVNAKPHIGHAFEKILADVLARWHRLQGDKTFLLTGTDENAQKNAEVAKQEGIPTQEFVDRNSKYFTKLCEVLNVKYDRFIRTTEEKHKKKSQEIFKTVFDKGDIYKGEYEGLYCKGCEAFLTERDLVDGKCPEHNKEPEQISEEAYFFKLSKYKDQLIKFIENYIVPKSKKNEILSRLKEEKLRDLCVSRTNLDWGIDSPIDNKFKIYVWFDALINYISGASGNWPADVHVVGKGINWFHSVIWPAMLMSAEIELPKKLLVHGYLTIDGQKISKSLSNAIDPVELAKKYPVDTIRYNLLRGSTFEDFDFSESELIERHNNELANKLGNLISRTSALAEKYGIEKRACPRQNKFSIYEGAQNNLLKKLNLKQIETHFDNFRIDKALSEIFAFIDHCNEFIQSQKPWETHDKKVLYQLVEAIREIAKLLSPFIPESAEKISQIFKTNKIKKAPILFQKIEIPKQNINKKEILNKTMENVTTIQFEDFAKLDLRVAEIQNVDDIPGADKLYKLSLSVGELGERTICAGIKQFYNHDDLKGKKIIIIANLEPRKLRGIESQGMLLAASTKDKKTVSLISPDQDIEVGSVVG